MTAVRLPNDDLFVQTVPNAAEAQATSPDVAAQIDRSAFLLVPPAFWEEMSTIAREMIEQNQRGMSAYLASRKIDSSAEETEEPA